MPCEGLACLRKARSLGEADDVEAAGLFAEVGLVDEEGADGVDLDADVDN